MIATLQSCIRQGHSAVKRWMLDPRIYTLTRGAAYVFAGFFLSAGSLAHAALPLAAGFVCACSGWSAALATVGGCLGYWLFWGSAGYQGILWCCLCLPTTLILGDRRLRWNTPAFMPVVTALIIAASGVIFQTWVQDATSVPVYLLRVALGAGSTWLLRMFLAGRNPILDWLVGADAVLALAQISLTPWLNIGFCAAAAISIAGAFPAAALAGLALDLAQISPVPMTAVLCCSFLVRFLPRYPRWLLVTAPAMAYWGILGLCGRWQPEMAVSLLLGALIGIQLPGPTRISHRRGETGAAQVRLELAAGVLSQTQQLLLEVPVMPIDENALVCRAAERACSGCPCRRNCPDAHRIAQLSAPLLHKPLLSSQELPIICRKSGRFLAELHRSQEQLRSIQADRERQGEYRSAMVQQYQFLSEYLRELSDQLARRTDTVSPLYTPMVKVFGNRAEGDNGDRCLKFPGIQCKYYVLLCDGMGTGLGAVQEGKTAAILLRRLLSAGFPAEYALRSFNSLCALRERPGAATVDLAELQLDSGKITLYKWGAMPSYAVSAHGADKLGSISAPPGLSVTTCQESTQQHKLRSGELLIMLSDGIGETEALQCCLKGHQLGAESLAQKLLECARNAGQDDATVVITTLEPVSETGVA